MISAFSKAAQVFLNDEYCEIAERSVNFILKNLTDKDGRLLHRIKNNVSGLPANADDYAFFIAGLLDLYETVFDSAYLKTAVDLNSEFIKYFWDEEQGGFYFTPSNGERLLFRQKEIYDGAVPSANSAAILNLLRIGRITGNSSYEMKASAIFKAFSKLIQSSPSSFSQALAALDFALGPSKEIVISGEKRLESTKKFLEIIRGKYIPNKVIILNQPEKDQLEIISPFVQSYEPLDKKTTIYICENYKCNMPLTDPDDLNNSL
jgi:uncharacterized protein YyaL (SSP411 family)